MQKKVRSGLSDSTYVFVSASASVSVSVAIQVLARCWHTVSIRGAGQLLASWRETAGLHAPQSYGQKPIMIGYKYTPEEFASAILDRGALKISLLSYFQKLERENSRIPDKLEGSVIGKLDHLERENLSSDNPDHAALMRKVGINLGKGSTIGKLTVTNHRNVQSVEDQYILSLCADAANEELKSDAGRAVIQLTNLRIIATELAKAHPNLLGPPTVRHVEYRLRHYHLVNDIPLTADAFTKEERFKSQREIRVAWPAIQKEKPFFISECPSICPYLTRIC